LRSSVQQIESNKKLVSYESIVSGFYIVSVKLKMKFIWLLFLLVSLLGWGAESLSIYPTKQQQVTAPPPPLTTTTTTKIYKR
jgi:hypothetical protein